MSDSFNATYDFDLGDGAAPAGVDPNAAGGRCPAGLHLMEVADFEVSLDETFKFKGEQCVTAKIKPALKVVDGPHTGSTVRDFLPMPYAGRAMIPGVANQWVNFIRALGFDLPAATDPATNKQVVTSLVPNGGFKIQHIIGKRCMVKVVTQTDGSGAPKLDSHGEPYTEPSFFGYSRVGTGTPAAPQTAQPATPAPSATRAPMAASAPVRAPLSITDL